MRTLILTIVLMAVCAGFATAQSYNDVLVVVNSNSQLSQDVGNYFVSARSIPSTNLCSIAMPTTEEIDSSQFMTIFNAIKSYISAQSLSGINYIVTTQGVPLKVRRNSSVFPPITSPYSDASSFDGDLALMNSTREQYVGNNGYVSNPYYGSSANFTRSSFQNIYLVTRLAGYNYGDIVALINKAAQPYNSNGTFLFDRDPTKSGWSIDQRMVDAHNVVTTAGFNSILNLDQTYVTGVNDVLGYVSWGSNDSYWPMYSYKARPNLTFCPKALAETYVSSSGRTFQDSTFVESTIGWQSLALDLLGVNGVTGIKGYVFEPYSFAMANVTTLFTRWTGGKNLAESYYSASFCIGWMDVVVGDPKTTLAGHGHLPVELTAFKGQFLDKYIKLEWHTATETDNYGFEVEKQSASGWTALGFVDGHGTSSAQHHYTFIDNTPMHENVYRLKQIDRSGAYEYSQVVTVAGSAIRGFALSQNYPNPFNPNTSISYIIPTDAAVTVQIFANDGRLVRTLAQDAHNSPGTHTLFWDGKNSYNLPAPTGNYFYRMSATVNGAPFFNAVKQMTLTK